MTLTDPATSKQDSHLIKLNW